MQPTLTIEQRKFPIGPFSARTNISDPELDEMILAIETAPKKYTEIATHLTQADLLKTYRDGSWNIQQLINHVADMQLLHYLRMKKALTEPDYKELTPVSMDGWASTPDGKLSPIDDSLQMFEGIAKRFVFLIRSLSPEQLGISYYHPVRKIMLDQKNAIAMSAWHVKHHIEHIRIALAS